MCFSERYLEGYVKCIEAIDRQEIADMVRQLQRLRQEKGRLFIVGSGGSAGNASHATCDFRKIVGIEAYCPSDNVSELTANVNDAGWSGAYAAWLQESRISPADALMVLSVGGGTKELSNNLVAAMRVAQHVACPILGIVGRDGGYTQRAADSCVMIPVIDTELVTAYSEAAQAAIWHLLVSHPDLQQKAMAWENRTCAKLSS